MLVLLCASVSNGNTLSNIHEQLPPFQGEGWGGDGVERNRLHTLHVKIDQTNPSPPRPSP